MNQFSLKIKIIIFLFLISTNSHGLSSSAYLIVQSAISSNDYYTASRYYFNLIKRVLIKIICSYVINASRFILWFCNTF